MELEQLLARMKELQAEFMIQHASGDFTFYRNLPLGIGFMNVYKTDYGRFEFIGYTDYGKWDITSKFRIPDHAQVINWGNL